MIHAAGLLSGTDEDEPPSSAPLSEAEETLSPEKGLSDTSGSCETKDGLLSEEADTLLDGTGDSEAEEDGLFSGLPGFSGLEALSCGGASLSLIHI